MDVATLGVRVTMDGVAQATSGLAGLGAAGERAAATVADFARAGANANQIAQLTGTSVSQARDAIQRFGGQAAVSAMEVRGLAAAEQEMAVAGIAAGSSFNLAGAGMGRVRQGLTSLVAQATGTIPVLDRLGGSMLAGFGVGLPTMIAVLGGIAAVSYAWKALQSDADKLAAKVGEAMKKVKEETLNAQLAMGDLQLAAAQKNAAAAQRELDLAKAGSYSGAAAKTGIASVDEAEVARRKKALDDANVDLLHWQNNKAQLDYQTRGEAEKANADYLATVVKSNHATAAERQRALDLYRKDVAEIAALGKSQTDNVRRVALIGQAESLRTSLFQSPADKAANRVDEQATDTVAKLNAETQSLLAENAARDRGTAALDKWRIANAGVVAVVAEENKQRDAANAAKERGSALSAVQIAVFAREADAIRAAAEANESAKVAVEHHAKAVTDISAMQARLEAIRAENSALKDTSDTRAEAIALAEYEKRVTEAKTIANLADKDAYLVVARAIRDASIETAQITEAKKADAAATKKAAAEENQIAKHMLEEVQHDVASFFNSVLTKGTASFRSLFDEIKNMFLKLLADMAAADIMKRVTPALSAMMGLPSGAAGAASGGGGGVGVSGLGASMVQAAAAGLGIAAAGYGVGSLVGSHTTNRALGALGGAASGAATGAAIGAMGGPIGVVAGAFIGAAAGAIGGFLGAGHAAAEAAKQLLAMKMAQAQVGASLADWRAQITGTIADQKAAAVADLYWKYLSIRQTIEQVEAGKKMEEQRNKDLAKADADYVLAQKMLGNAINALTNTMLNAVNGFKYQAAIFAAAGVHNAPTTPTSSGSSGGSQGNSGGNGGAGGPDTINVKLVLSDGTVLASTVVKSLKARAQKQFGDSTKWALTQ